MGTNNLTRVYVNGKLRVCQYGCNDGYPTAMGRVVLNFCTQKYNIERLFFRLAENFIYDIGLDPEPEMLTMLDKLRGRARSRETHWILDKLFGFSPWNMDWGYNILYLIALGPVPHRGYVLKQEGDADYIEGVADLYLESDGKDVRKLADYSLKLTFWGRSMTFTRQDLERMDMDVMMEKFRSWERSHYER